MATPITPVSVIPAANTWTQLGSAVAASHVQGANVRVTNVSGVDANAKIRLNNGTTIVNRGGTYPVPGGSSDSIQDLEQRCPLPATWYFEVWASASANLEFSLTGWDDLA